jgi:hypothetical protein
MRQLEDIYGRIPRRSSATFVVAGSPTVAQGIAFMAA